MGYENWPLSALRGEYSSLSGKMSGANAKLGRLQAAWSALKVPKSTCEGVKKRFQSGSYSEKSGYWKGKLRTKFDQDMDSLGYTTKRAWSRMDEFHDEINHQISKAKIEAGKYVPVLTEIEGLIKKHS